MVSTPGLVARMSPWVLQVNWSDEIEAEDKNRSFTYTFLSRQFWSSYYVSNMVMEPGDGKTNKIVSSKPSL